MTDSEKIQKIEQIVNMYIKDNGEDHWADYYMEQVCDVILGNGVYDEKTSNHSI